MSPTFERLRDEIVRINGVEESPSMFKDGKGFWVNGKEIAHFEGDEGIDIRLTRAVIRDLRNEFRLDDRLRLRPRSSDWVTVSVASVGDIAFAVALVERAAAAHLPAHGAIPDAPPTGPALARRRRFH
jgi:hypothetical protein